MFKDDYEVDHQLTSTLLVFHPPTLTRRSPGETFTHSTVIRRLSSGSRQKWLSEK
jgi:hypothetical protein